MRGFCSKCGRPAGGAFRPRLWQCPKCWKVFCDDCTPDRRVGIIFKKPVCDDCFLELVDGGVRARRPPISVS